MSMITTDDGIVACGCRTAGECDHNWFAEVRALEKMVDALAEEMKAKLRSKYFRGYSGWDDPANRDLLLAKLKEHAERNNQWNSQEVDIANLAAMLWNIRQYSPEETDA
jgi:hypothetical protein